MMDRRFTNASDLVERDSYCRHLLRFSWFCVEDGVHSRCLDRVDGRRWRDQFRALSRAPSSARA